MNSFEVYALSGLTNNEAKSQDTRKDPPKAKVGEKRKRKNKSRRKAYVYVDLSSDSSSSSTTVFDNDEYWHE